MANISNISNTTSELLVPSPNEIITKPASCEEWETWQILVLVIPLSLLILEIVIGNLMVIIAVLTERNLRTPSNMIILSLAMADLTVAVFILPFNILDMILCWRFGKVLCRIWLTSDVTLCSTSILHISAIAVDRFRSINEGVQYAQSRTIRMSLVVCGALWIIALWIASSPVLGWNDWEFNGPLECILTRELGYIIHSASGAFFIPGAIMVALYFRIFLLIRKKLRERAKLSCVSRSSKLLKRGNESEAPVPPADQGAVETEEEPSGDVAEDPSTDATRESIPIQKAKKSIDSTSSNNNGGMSRKKHSEQIETILKNKLRYSLSKERKAAKTLGVIIGAFIICWTPFTLTYLTSGVFVEWNKGKKEEEEHHVPLWFFQFVTWLGYVNSGLNPIIYTIYNPEFRRAFKNIWRRMSCQR